MDLLIRPINIGLIMNTGEYRNNMVFAATYDVRFENCNFYPFEIKDFCNK